ncbi:hypothetical protein B0A56_08465, partial [Flavobacterium columnare NBRC 100251 = ATCC 23463]
IAAFLYSEKTELNIKIPCKTGDFLSQQSNYVPIIKENQENKKLSKKSKKTLGNTKRNTTFAAAKTISQIAKNKRNKFIDILD